jgi:hypothetical protein
VIKPALNALVCATTDRNHWRSGITSHGVTPAPPALIPQATFE